jgi:histidyl-tRNA synthetase
MRRQLQIVFEMNIKFMFIIGQNEVANGQVKLKIIEEKRELTIPYGEIIGALKENLI